MSVKSDARKCGRLIRRLTKIPLPIAMRLGRLVVRGEPSYCLRDKFPEYVRVDGRVLPCGCSEDYTITFTGKSSVTFQDYVSLEKIQKSYEASMG